MPKKDPKKETLSASAAEGTTERIRMVLRAGETRSQFVNEAVMQALELRERLYDCHDFRRDPEQRGYVCVNCGNLRMHHLTADVKRAAESTPRMTRSTEITCDFYAPDKYLNCVNCGRPNHRDGT